MSSKIIIKYFKVSMYGIKFMLPVSHFVLITYTVDSSEPASKYTSEEEQKFPDARGKNQPMVVKCLF